MNIEHDRIQREPVIFSPRYGARFKDLAASAMRASAGRE